MDNTFKLNRIFQNGMVLQQKCKNCISGSGASGSSVTLVFRKRKYTSKVNADGKWKIVFNPGEAGGPDVLSVSDSNGNDKTLTNIYTGEVWLCSGQSNMQLPMERLQYTYPEEMTAPLNEQIRIFTVPISYSFDGEQDDLPGGEWNAASPETIPTFSGTSYFLAKKLQHDLQVPVGIINASQGGSPISSWISESVAKKWPLYQESLAQCKDKSYVESEKQKNADANNAWFEKCGSIDRGFAEKWNETGFETALSWEDFSIPGVLDSFTKGGTVWFKKEFELSEKDMFVLSQHKIRMWLGTIIDSDTVWVNGVQCGTTKYQYPPRRYEIPADVLHAGQNCITMRVIHCGKVISFIEDKPCCIYSDNVIVKPTMPGTVIGTRDGAVLDSDAVYVDLHGVWKMKEGCSLEEKPGDLFFEWKPTALYNAMLAPCFTYAVRGFVWYQGESDTGNPKDYEVQLSQMIALWREKFCYHVEKNSPFIVVQLPNCGEKNDMVIDSGWAKVREAERQAAYENKNCGLAVTVDVGEWNDLHPENKEAVGTRCAFEAMRLAYEKQVPVSPSVKKIKKTDDGICIEMTGDVICKGNEMPVISCILKGYSGMESICRMNVQAIAHSKIIAALPPDEMGRKSKIIQVFYAWCDSPVKTVLYDKSGTLPVGPFRVKL